MTGKTVFLFSGQGSQHYQMGRELYEQDRVFRLHMDWMDTLVADVSGRSVLAALYGPRGKSEPFDDICLTHPAIFMAEYALARSVMSRGVQPDACVGASLGTMAAMAVAGRVRAEDALGMVVRQGMLVARDGPRGAMIAVMAEPRQIMADARLAACTCVAGQNFASHFVLATPARHTGDVLRILGDGGYLHQVLPVSYPFHSQWVESLQPAIVADAAALRVREANVEVWCCAAADVLRDWTPGYFWQVLRKPIAFADTIARIESAGPCSYVDLGPAGTLSTFLKYLLPERADAQRLGIMAPFGSDVARLELATRLLGGEAPVALGA